MARRMSPEREKEFEELLGFLEFHFEHVQKPKLPSNFPEQKSLRDIAERIALEHGRSKALEGTRQATNDVIEEMKNLKPEGVLILDDALRAAGLATLSELRRRYSSMYQKVLRRGSIASDTEYYLVNGLVVDLSSELTPAERETLQAMVSAYEG